MKDILEGINQYIIDYKQPTTNQFINIIDKLMASLAEMEEYLGNIDDERKREVMKRNVSMAQQLLVDNMEMFNEYLNKKAKEE